MGFSLLSKGFAHLDVLLFVADLSQLGLSLLSQGHAWLDVFPPVLDPATFNSSLSLHGVG